MIEDSKKVKSNETALSTFYNTKNNNNKKKKQNTKKNRADNS